MYRIMTWSGTHLSSRFYVLIYEGLSVRCALGSWSQGIVIHYHLSVFLLSEPIVVLFSIYISIVYAILYAFFAAFPIVFQQIRGFSPGEGGLAFLGVGLGVALGTALAPLQNKLYREAMRQSPTGRAPPES